VTPESKGVKGLMDAIRSKNKSPAKKSRDVVMTSPTKEGSLSGTGFEREKGFGDHGPGSGDCGVSHTQDN
jgi:hypothetical protein